MKVVRYVNGKKVQETEEVKPASSNPAVVPSAPKRIVKKVTSAPPKQPAQPNKGCGCGR